MNWEHGPKSSGFPSEHHPRTPSAAQTRKAGVDALPVFVTLWVPANRGTGTRATALWSPESPPFSIPAPQASPGFTVRRGSGRGGGAGTQVDV